MSENSSISSSSTSFMVTSGATARAVAGTAGFGSGA
jgi:hypothetical protein